MFGFIQHFGKIFRFSANVNIEYLLLPVTSLFLCFFAPNSGDATWSVWRVLWIGPEDSRKRERLACLPCVVDSA